MTEVLFPIHDLARCEECRRRARKIEEKKILDFVAKDGGLTIEFARDGDTWIVWEPYSRVRLSELIWDERLQAARHNPPIDRTSTSWFAGGKL